MKSWFPSLLFLAVVAAAAAGAAAAPDSIPPVADLDRAVTMTAQHVPSDVLFRVVAAQTGLDIKLAPRLAQDRATGGKGPFPALTGTFDGIRAKYLIGWLVHLSGAKATVRNGVVHVLPSSSAVQADPVFECFKETEGIWREELSAHGAGEANLVSVTLNGVPMRNFLDMLFRISGAQMLLEPELERDVRAMSTPLTLKFEDTPYIEVLDYAAKKAGIRWRFQGGLVFIRRTARHRADGSKSTDRDPELDLRGAALSDLSILKGTPLVRLSVAKTQVTDLRPLRGMPLHDLDISDTGVTELAPLRGMRLRGLSMRNIRVKDLSPLAGMPLRDLHLSGTDVTDLSLLRRMPLKYLSIEDTKIDDLTPIRWLQLKWLSFSPERIRTGMSGIRRMESLWRINRMDPAEFWRTYDATHAPDPDTRPQGTE